MQALEKDFQGDAEILRVIFSTSNPIHTLHLLKTEIPYKTYVEYLEYMDANTTLTEYARQVVKQ